MESKEKIAATFKLKRENLIRLQNLSYYRHTNIDSFLDRLIERYLNLTNIEVMEHNQFNRFRESFMRYACETIAGLREKEESEEDWKMNKAMVELFTNAAVDDLMMSELYKVYKRA